MDRLVFLVESKELHFLWIIWIDPDCHRKIV